MPDISKCLDELIILAEKQGYLTFDDILNASDAFSLSVTGVDFLSEAIQLRGIIVYETAPNNRQESDDEEFLDYSRTDYNVIFEEVLDLAPQLICNDLCQDANCLDRITTDHFRVLGRHLEGALTSVFGI